MLIDEYIDTTAPPSHSETILAISETRMVAAKNLLVPLVAYVPFLVNCDFLGATDSLRLSAVAVAG
jgi:hypothetical protein